MKKLLSLVLVLATVFAMSVPAFASPLQDLLNMEEVQELGLDLKVGQSVGMNINDIIEGRRYFVSGEETFAALAPSYMQEPESLVMSLLDGVIIVDFPSVSVAYVQRMTADDITSGDEEYETFEAMMDAFYVELEEVFAAEEVVEMFGLLGAEFTLGELEIVELDGTVNAACFAMSVTVEEETVQMLFYITEAASGDYYMSMYCYLHLTDEELEETMALAGKTIEL